MVDLTRRKTVIGLGLLATGSGATFTQAAFASDVTPASDLRVVTGQGLDESLRVEAGDIFRQDNGDFNAGSGSDDITTLNLDSNSFFTPSTGDPDTNALDDLTVDDLPAAGANDEFNEDLRLALATKIGENPSIGNYGANGNGETGFIQINNNTPDDHDIAVRFDVFGEDVTDGPVSDDEVTEIYQFYTPNGDLISPDNIRPDNTQEVPNTLTVPSGEISQIWLRVNTEDNYDSIADAANVEDSPFVQGQDTVDLVNSIKVGVEE
jgi:hypothetical protein